MALHRSSVFREALSQWVAEGLVSPDAAQTLTSRYELDRESPWYRNTSFMIGLVASALVSAGLVLFISENWHNLPIPVRMLTGIIPWLAAAILTIRATSHEPRATSQAWGFLTSLLFGVNIFLQAQIFHLGGFWPTALLWWSAGTLAVGYALSSASIIALAQGLGILWINSLTTYDQYSPIVLVGTAVIATATVGKLTRTTTTGLIALICWTLAHVWGALEFQGMEVIAFWSTLALLAIALYQWAEPISRRFRDIMSVLLGGWVVILTLIVSTSTSAATVLLSHGDWFTGVLAALAISLLLVVRRDVWTYGISLLVAWLVASSLLPSDAWAETVSIGINVILFGMSVMLMWAGIKHARKTEFMTAMILIIAHAFTRFTDYFDDYLIGAVVFMAAGIVLFVANTLWNRRYATH